MLHYWHNPYIVQLIQANVDTILPIVFDPLYRSSKHHWHNAIHSMSFSALRAMMRMNQPLFDACSSNFKQHRQMYVRFRRPDAPCLCFRATSSCASTAFFACSERQRRREMDRLWAQLEERAAENAQRLGLGRDVMKSLHDGLLNRRAHAYTCAALSGRF